jgi:hypothetical protein
VQAADDLELRGDCGETAARQSGGKAAARGAVPMSSDVGAYSSASATLPTIGRRCEIRQARRARACPACSGSITATVVIAVANDAVRGLGIVFELIRSASIA